MNRRIFILVSLICLLYNASHLAMENLRSGEKSYSVWIKELEKDPNSDVEISHTINYKFKIKFLNSNNSISRNVEDKDIKSFISELEKYKKDGATKIANYLKTLGNK